MADDQLTVTFAALADPTRRAILAHLMSGQASVSELAEPFEISLPAISKHLKTLERAGLITRGREAQWRPCRIQAAPLKDAADWIETYRTAWEQRLDRLQDYLREVQAKEKKELEAREVGGEKRIVAEESKERAPHEGKKEIAGSRKRRIRRKGEKSDAANE